MFRRVIGLALLAVALAWAAAPVGRASHARGPVAELVEQVKATARAQTDNGGRDAFKVLVAVCDGNGSALAQMLQDSSGGAFTCEYMAANLVNLRRPDSLLAAGVAAIITYTNYTYLNSTMFGDTLAKFVDLGGGAIVMVFADYAPWNIAGRFATQYMPVPFTSNTYTSGTLGTVYEPSHPIMQGVTTVGCGNYKTGATAIAHAPWTTRIADWVGGQVECAAFDSAGRRVVWLGFFGSGNWIGGLSGQWCRQIVNAIRWVSVFHDVGCSRLIAPTGTLDSGAVVTPACSVYNYGNQTETYRVRMTIGSYTDTVRINSHAPGTARYAEFASWTALNRAGYTARCSTECVEDNNANNDRKTATVTVRVRDAGVASLTAPRGQYSRGAIVSPSATWRNYGNVNASFEAWVKLYDPADAEVYARKVDIANLVPGASLYVTAFPPCTLATGGDWNTRCSTYYSGDLVPANDVLADTFDVSIGNPDIGAQQILAPVNRIDTGATVVPQARVRNFGDVDVPFRAWFIMNNPADAEVYREVLNVPGLRVNTDTVLSFPSFNVGTVEGTWTSRCSVYTPFDTRSQNDFVSGTFRVSASLDWPHGWVEVEPMPAGAKPVKDGGWLAEDGDFIYAAKGNKSPEFYLFNVLADSNGAWTSLTPIPNGTEGKPPSKGCVGVVADGFVYMTKGNNTSGFWRYHPDSMSWTQMPDVPAGPSGKKVKGGTDMVYIKGQGQDTGYIYLLKGYKDEFFRFNTETMTWDTTLPPAPTGAKAKWDKGSWLVERRYNPGSTYYIYAHKAKYHELWVFDHATKTWGSSALPGMPLTGMMGKSKKAKDGSSAAIGNGGIYALKGGNTQEFWRFDFSLQSWTERETIPAFGSSGKKKRVKAGADIVSFGRDAFFALKGNKSLEVWRYVDTVDFPVYRPRPQGGAQAGVATAPVLLTAGRQVRYVLPGSGLLSVSVFDVTGRTVLRQAAAGRSGSLDLSGLSAGVYLARFEGQDLRLSRKLVVE